MSTFIVCLRTLFPMSFILGFFCFVFLLLSLLLPSQPFPHWHRLFFKASIHRSELGTQALLPGGDITTCDRLCTNPATLVHSRIIEQGTLSLSLSLSFSLSVSLSLPLSLCPSLSHSLSPPLSPSPSFSLCPSLSLSLWMTLCLSLSSNLSYWITN